MKLDILYFLLVAFIKFLRNEAQRFFENKGYINSNPGLKNANWPKRKLP